jgi:hypothetical protein
VSTAFREALLALGGRLVAAWAADDATGSTLAATKGPAGTYAAGISPGWLSPVPSDPNRAHRYFPGTALASVPDQATLDLANGPATLVVAARRDATANGVATLIDKGTNAYAAAFNFDKATVSQSGVGSAAAEQNTTVDSEPHLFFFEVNGPSSYRIWKDGVDVTSDQSTRTLADNASALAIGGNPTGRDYFTGSLEAYVVSGLLTATDRHAIVDAFTGTQTPSATLNITDAADGSAITALSFTGQAGSGTTTDRLHLAMSDGTARSVEIVETASWLSVSRTTGVTPFDVDVVADFANVQAGTQQTILTINVLA